MKFDYKSYSNHLETENERLNAIIDKLEEINNKQLTEIFMLNVTINNAIEYIKENCTNYYVEEPHYRGVELINIEELLEILGDKENEET